MKKKHLPEGKCLDHKLSYIQYSKPIFIALVVMYATILKTKPLGKLHAGSANNSLHYFLRLP